MKISLEELHVAYEAGASVRELAERFGVTHQAISGRLRYHGIALRPKGARYRLENKVCAFCGQTFHPRTINRFFCSQDCYAQSKTLTHCKRGHALTADNRYKRQGKTPPRCKQCAREAQLRYLARKKATL